MKPASANSGATTMQKPATILRKWWASEIPNMSPPLLLPSGSSTFTPACVARYEILHVLPGPVEIFQEAVEALNRVDLDAMRRICDPEIVFLPLRAAVTGPFIGHKGMEDFVEENAQRFDLFQAEFDELEALPDGRLLAIGFILMRSKGGKAETRYRTAGIATFRGERMTSWHDYGDVDVARAEA